MTNEEFKALKDLLLEAPDGHLDKVAVDSIREWEEPTPKAIQILKTLDMCVHAGLSSGFVIGVLEQILYYFMSKEKKTYEELTKEATWREKNV
jgi:hypothetical protein